LCNREIKFDVFLKHAMALGADYVATGHYCRKSEEGINGRKVYNLLAGLDPNKDQSYFLCQLNQYQLEKALFPIGELLKSEVRAIAEKAGLSTAKKKDSQGLCFIGKVKLPDFLKQQLNPKTGNIVEIDSDHAMYTSSNDGIEEVATPFKYNEEDGKVVGQHHGAHYFTIGQRKGLDVGGTPLPLFVIATDVNTNTVYVGQGDNHPGLFRNALKIEMEDIHFLREDMCLSTGGSREFDIRIRYRQPLVKGKLHMKSDALYIEFYEAMKSITAGQFAAWYIEDKLIGSGVIQA